MKEPELKNELATTDRSALESAVGLLENPGLMARVSNVIGAPLEKAISLLPEKASETIGSAAQKAIMASLKLALKTMDTGKAKGDAAQEASNWWHKGATALSGGIGGFFGITALLVELPISTTIMMRSIADVARSEGANLDDTETQIECVKVLALGGPTKADDGSELGYFATREALAKATADALKHIAKHGLEKEGAPALVKLILMIAERYSIQVSEKAAAQLVPAIGAAGGALINTFFIDHFQDMARGHFIVSRLEKQYGSDLIRKEYDRIKQTRKAIQS